MPMNVTIVGGFAASTLRWQNTSAKLIRIWYSSLELARFGPEGLTLAPNGVDPQPPGGLPLIPGPGYEFGAFDAVKSQLVADKWTVSYFAWDWRRSLIGQAQRLAAALATTYGSNAFSVVAHSAGGLLALLAYPVWQALNTGGSWSSTLFLATPFGGSYWGPAGQGVVVADGWWLYSWLLSFVNSMQGNFPGSLGIGSTANQRIGRATASWPSLYELFPSQQLPWGPLNPNMGPLYTVAPWTKANPAVTQQHLTDAITTQQRLSAVLTLPRSPATIVAGTGFDTLTGFVADGNPGVADSYVVTGDGDGTVPTRLATLAGSPSVQGPWTHVGMLQDGGIVNNLTTWLLNPPTSDVTVPPPALKGVPILEGTPPQGPGMFIPIPGNPLGPNSLGGLDP